MANSVTPTGIHSNHPYADLSVQLSEAIARLDVQEVRNLLLSNVSRTTPDSSGLTPIEQAMKLSYEDGQTVLLTDRIEITEESFNRRLEIVELILEHHTPINETSEEAKLCLLLATRMNKPNLVKLLLELGVDSNTKAMLDCDFEEQRPALFFALEFGNREIVEHLLQHKAETNVNYYDSYGDCQYPPLIQVINSDQSDLEKQEMVELLLTFEADVNGFNVEKSQNPIHLAVEMGDQDMVKLLHQYGADLNLPDGEGEHPITKALKDKNLEMAEFLLGRGANINFFSVLGAALLAEDSELAELQNLLLNEALRQNPQMLIADKIAIGKDIEKRVESMRLNNGSTFASAKFLLNHEFNIDIKGPEGQTHLIKAAKENQLNAARFLCENKADVDAQDEHGNTALHYAVMENKLDMIELLMANGARCDLANKKEELPENLTNNEEILGLFSQAKNLACKGSEE